ncbi:hypothetical protein A9Q84_04950 [Halobacteriovorax marinus]|uniref:histidine kinase n=1 Tax=Halobacteriovorax marinus TaxID=97084 RepID=A0A1Y5FGF8_9BACT|nr:hypothetical protein A9Q84_04950 [Halobacteriovorax marinus]
MFLIAFIVDKKVAENKKSKLVNNPLIYSLSLAVYCTSWTFYGSVGKASSSGLLFLTIYLGPTLMVTLWWVFAKKLIRVKEKYHVTSIVDYISGRYDKSERIAFIGAVVVLLSTIPYIALQLKALVSTFIIITGFEDKPNLSEVKFLVAWGTVALMGLFTILFGIRKLDPTERHPGMIFVLAIECVFKLFVFLCVGIFVCFWLNDGFFEVLRKIPEVVPNEYSFMGHQDGGLITWISYTILSASAIIFLPRQFHVAIIENYQENHVSTASWALPSYLFLINLFVIPISIVGISLGLSSTDQYVLTIPYLHGVEFLSLLTFLGGFAAASGMIMISTMTVATIITNHIYLPLVTRATDQRLFTRFILPVRWICAILTISASCIYMQVVGEKYALVSMGMISFTGALQFMPLILGSIFWKKGNKLGAMFGLLSGSLIWFYTLYFPTFIKSGYIQSDILEEGLFGITLLRPESLLGLSGIDPLSHAVFWSMFFNIGAYVTISSLFKRSQSEEQIVNEYLNLFEEREDFQAILPETAETNILLIGKKKIIEEILIRYYSELEIESECTKILDEAKVLNREMVNILELSELRAVFENKLAGLLGAAVAHKVVGASGLLNVTERNNLYKYYSDTLAEYSISPSELHTRVNFYREKEKLVSNQYQELEGLVDLRTNELIERNIQLEKSIKKINTMREQLIEQEKQASLGNLVAGVAHEIKNPLNFINNGSKAILFKIDELSDIFLKGDFDQIDRLEIVDSFEDIAISSELISRHGERASNIISHMLLLSREKGQTKEYFNLKELIYKNYQLQLTTFKDKHSTHINEIIRMDEIGDMFGCPSNLGRAIYAIFENSFYEFSKCYEIDKEFIGEIEISLSISKGNIKLVISDNGRGIPENMLERVWEPFFTTKPSSEGTGLGLSITYESIRIHNGTVKVSSSQEKGTEFTIVFNNCDIKQNDKVAS